MPLPWLEWVGGFPLTALKRQRFCRIRSFDGVSCYRISGRHPHGGRVVIWIGVSDLLIRKLVKHRFRQEELRFNIRVDEPIAAEVLRVPSKS